MNESLFTAETPRRGVEHKISANSAVSAPGPQLETELDRTVGLTVEEAESAEEPSSFSLRLGVSAVSMFLLA